MSSFLQWLLRLIFHLGYVGPILMGVLDSSFLFLPFGNDLVIVVLATSHRGNLELYVLGAATGSTIGCLLIDLIARKGGEAGIGRLMKPNRFQYLKRKIQKRGAVALTLGCLAPPPFPFTMVVAATSALGYSRKRLFPIVWLGRAGRFSIIALLALHYGRTILRVANSPAFRWTMTAFIVVCLVGSGWSVAKWLKNARSRQPA